MSPALVLACHRLACSINPLCCSAHLHSPSLDLEADALGGPVLVLGLGWQQLVVQPRECHAQQGGELLLHQPATLITLRTSTRCMAIVQNEADAPHMQEAVAGTCASCSTRMYTAADAPS